MQRNNYCRFSKNLDSLVPATQRFDPPALPSFVQDVEEA
jgi:hypothetical protein